MEQIIKIEKISKAFPGVQALDRVSLELRKNQVLGLVGENGAGKSTLMKIIAGVYSKDSGSFILNKKDFLPLIPDFFPLISRIPLLKK